MASSSSMVSWIRALTATVDEGQQIKLQMESHRGHRSKYYHIRHVLEEGTTNSYNSLGHGPPDEDWFVFRMEKKKRFVPETIMIRNFPNNAALKRISISGKGDDGQFTEW